MKLEAEFPKDQGPVLVGNTIQWISNENKPLYFSGNFLATTDEKIADFLLKKLDSVN